MQLAAEAAATTEQNRLLQWIVRLRIPIFALVALYYVLAFNGQWRVGRDSSLYRGVAHSLATGKGYQFRGEPERHIFPGLPLLLAGIEKLRGGSNVFRPVPELLVMVAMALVTLLVIYRMVSLHFPPWVAVHVTTVCGIHWRFLQQANELMSDTPFTLGVCLSLLGFELLRLGRGRRWKAILMLVGGLVLAAIMRPTFYALAAAFVLTGVWEIFRGRSRRTWLAVVGVMVGVGMLWMMLDPRTRSFRPTEGAYEQRAVEKVEKLTWLHLGYRSVQTLEEHFPEAIFGVQLFPTPDTILRKFGATPPRIPLPGLNTLASLLILGCAVGLMGRFPLWGLLVLVTLAMTICISSVPRYFLMILPLVVLGWTVPLHALSRQFTRWPWAPEAVMLLGLGLFTGLNGGKSVGFILEQHGWTRHGFRPFMEVYRDGKMKPVVEMSELIRRNVKLSEKVIGNEPSIMSYLSGRRVYLLSEVKKPLTGQHLSSMKFRWAVYPIELYKTTENNRVTYEFMRSRLWQTRFRAGQSRPVRSGKDMMWLDRLRYERPAPSTAPSPARASATTRPATRSVVPPP